MGCFGFSQAKESKATGSKDHGLCPAPPLRVHTRPQSSPIVPTPVSPRDSRLKRTSSVPGSRTMDTGAAYRDQVSQPGNGSSKLARGSSGRRLGYSGSGRSSPTARGGSFGGVPQPLPTPEAAQKQASEGSESRSRPITPRLNRTLVPSKFGNSEQPASGPAAPHVTNPSATSAAREALGSACGSPREQPAPGNQIASGFDATSPISSPSSPHASSMTGSPRPFTLSQLEYMTSNFDPQGLLGEGGFGCVYKGFMMDSNPTRSAAATPVAVKALDVGGLQGEREWLSEVDLLGHLRHPHLVRLLGYCAEEEQRLLVYDFMPRGSLEHCLFRTGQYVLDPPMPWALRVKVAVGAARGLAYLHEEAEHQIIFRDFKTSNVLLDSQWDARLSDFGLARCGPEGDASHVTTRVVGTIGYAAPEYVLTGHLTAKTDVWAFGVVLLELLTGRLALDKDRPKSEQNLVDWASEFLQTPSRLYRIMDPSLGGMYAVKGAQLLASVARQCLQKKPKARPRMSEVVALLQPAEGFRDMAGFTADQLASISEGTARAAAPTTRRPRRNGEVRAGAREERVAVNAALPLEVAVS